jgi:hypothetical protein
VVRNFRVHTICSSGHRKTVVESFFIKPELKIIYEPEDKTVEYISELEDHRWGVLEETDIKIFKPEGLQFPLPPFFYPKRRFINILVKNEGRGLAENCEVNIRLLDKANGCQWLSYEEKPLVWNEGSIRTTIGARGDKAMFHLVFSQQRLTTNQKDLITPLYCSIAKKKVGIRTWIGSKKALEKPEYRDQDGLCQGEFTVHVEVFTEHGHKAYKHFTIVVGGDWHKLNVSTIAICQCSTKSSLSERFLPLFHRKR